MDSEFSELPPLPSLTIIYHRVSRYLSNCEVNLVTSLVLVVAIVGLFLNYVERRKIGSKKSAEGGRRLPGPMSWPIIGSLFEIGALGQKCKDDMNEFCKRLCAKYGSVLAFKVGVQNFVVVEDPDVCRHIFNHEDWCSRVPTKPLFLEYFVHLQKLGIILNDGDDYKETRRFTLRCLKEFGFGQLQNMGNVIQEEVDHFITNFEARHSSSSSVPLFDENNNELEGPHFQDITLRFTFNIPSLNIIWKYLCGTRFECGDPFMQRAVATVQLASECVAYATKPMYAFPFLRFVPPGRADQQLLIRMFAEMRSIIKEVVDVKKKDGTYKTEQNDFIDMFLNNIDKSASSKVFTEDQLIQTCADLAMAGSDTTGNSIEYAILYMMQFPHEQRAVQKEIDSVIGLQRKPTIDDRNKMPYTEATILEILRCANVIAFDYRTALRDTEICGATVPKSTMALINLAQIHKDEKLWGDPAAFRPSRFLSEDMEIINTNKLYAFGGGKRLCIGKSMAKATMFIFFTTLLQRYSFEPSAKYPNFSIHSFTGGFTTRPNKFYCTIKPRHIIS